MSNWISRVGEKKPSSYHMRMSSLEKGPWMLLDGSL
jgi:hypothetical protein